MKFLSLLLIAMMFSFSAFSDTYVRGYYRKNGTYVQPHYRTNSNSTRLDNYSTRGNVNPYNGRVGTLDPYSYSNSYGTKTRSRSKVDGW
jgi:hypothetical protein